MMKGIIAGLLAFVCLNSSLWGGLKHSKTPMFDGLENRVVTGYQAWFRCPGDESGKNIWVHWNGPRGFNPKSCTVDYWPDTREYKKLYDTGFKNADGSVAKVFSSADKDTVDVHFRWMREYGIDAAFVQRFFGLINDPVLRDSYIEILRNAKSAAKANKVGFVVMYDLSGMPRKNAARTIIEDWKYLVDNLDITGGENSPYLCLDKKPLVVLWGIGLTDRHYSPKSSDIIKAIEFLKNDPVYGGCSIMVGVPTNWRTLDGDCVRDKDFHEFLKKYADVISPWFVGRFRMGEDGVHRDVNGRDFKSQVSGDVALSDDMGKIFLPVIYPGFSWHNLMNKRSPLGDIAREKGKFFWNMASQAVEGGAKCIYVAMFDEVDEGTAIFKCSNNPPSSAECPFLTYEGLPEDYYLTLAGKFKDMLKAGKPLPQPKPMAK